MKARLVLAAGLCFAALSPSFANHEVMRSTPFIEGEAQMMAATGCDTLDQATEVVGVWAGDGFDAFTAWMRTIGQTPNEIREPICGNVVMPMTAVGTHGQADVEYQGGTITVYLVEFILANGQQFFALVPQPSVASGQGT